MYGEEDAEAGDGDADREDGEEEAVAREVREHGNEHREPKGDGPRRDRVELSLYRIVFVGGDDGWAEVCVAVGGPVVM